MSTGRPPPGSIPTLTEVVSWPAVAPAAVAPAAIEQPAVASPAVASPAVAPPVPVQPAPVPATAAPVAIAVAIDEAQLQQRILADIQKQVDLMLEVRLREALSPALRRATDALVRDARKELTSTLRDIVAKSVARELDRRDEP